MHASIQQHLGEFNFANDGLSKKWKYNEKNTWSSCYKENYLRPAGARLLTKASRMSARYLCKMGHANFFFPFVAASFKLPWACKFEDKYLCMTAPFWLQPPKSRVNMSSLMVRVSGPKNGTSSMQETEQIVGKGDMWAALMLPHGFHLSHKHFS